MATFQSAEGGRLLEVGLYLFGSTQMIKFDGWFRRRTLHVPNLLEETGTIFAAWKYENEVIKGYETIYFLSISHDRLRVKQLHVHVQQTQRSNHHNPFPLQAKFRFVEISPRRIFALAKFRECEFSLWRNFRKRNFASVDAKFRLTQRKYVSALTKFCGEIASDFRENKERKTSNFVCISFSQYCSLSIYSHQVGLAFWVLFSVYVLVAV